MKPLLIFFLTLFTVPTFGQENLKLVESLQEETGLELEVSQNMRVSKMEEKLGAKRCELKGKSTDVKILIHTEKHRPPQHIVNFFMKGMKESLNPDKIKGVSNTLNLVETVQYFRQFEMITGDSSFFLTFLIAKVKSKQVAFIVSTTKPKGGAADDDFNFTLNSILELFSLANSSASLTYETRLKFKFPESVKLSSKKFKTQFVNWTFKGNTTQVEISKQLGSKASAPDQLKRSFDELEKTIKPTSKKDVTRKRNYKFMLKAYKQMIWQVDGKDTHVDCYVFDYKGALTSFCIVSPVNDEHGKNKEYKELSKLIDESFLYKIIKVLTDEEIILNRVSASLFATLNRDRRNIEKSFLPHKDLALLYTGKKVSATFIHKRQELIFKAEIKILAVGDKFVMNNRTYKVSDKFSNKESKVVRVKMGSDPDYLLLKKVGGSWLVDPRTMIARRKQALAK